MINCILAEIQLEIADHAAKLAKVNISKGQKQNTQIISKRGLLESISGMENSIQIVLLVIALIIFVLFQLFLKKSFRKNLVDIVELEVMGKKKSTSEIIKDKKQKSKESKKKEKIKIPFVLMKKSTTLFEKADRKQILNIQNRLKKSIGADLSTEKQRLGDNEIVQNEDPVESADMQEALDQQVDLRKHYYLKKLEEEEVDKESEVAQKPKRENESQDMPPTPKDSLDEKLCIICFAEPSNCVYLPCGHGGTCTNCAKAICKSTGECHLCKGVKTMFI